MYCDALYLIQPGETQVWTILECIDFCHFEGKTLLSVFERELAKGLTKSLFSTAYTVGSELLICAYLSTVDNFDNKFEEKLIEKLTPASLRAPLLQHEASTDINEGLITLCVTKGLLLDETLNSVEVYLQEYGQTLYLEKQVAEEKQTPAEQEAEIRRREELEEQDRLYAQKLQNDFEAAERQTNQNVRMDLESKVEAQVVLLSYNAL